MLVFSQPAGENPGVEIAAPAATSAYLCLLHGKSIIDNPARHIYAFMVLQQYAVLHAGRHYGVGDRRRGCGPDEQHDLYAYLSGRRFLHEYHKDPNDNNHERADRPRGQSIIDRKIKKAGGR